MTIYNSQYKMLNPEWENSGVWRGFDGGYNLKSDTGWHEYGNGADIFELTIKPGGYRFTSGYFFGPTSEGGYWTSTEFDNSTAWNRYFSFS